VLRQAFTQAMRDPALIDEVGKSGVDIDPLPGAELQRVVDATFHDRTDEARSDPALPMRWNFLLCVFAVRKEWHLSVPCVRLPSL
jgi:hypothetical protein